MNKEKRYKTFTYEEKGKVLIYYGITASGEFGR